MRFAQLHNHTVYSIKDAIAQPIDYVKKIHKFNKSQSKYEVIALAASEHSNMFSTIKNHIACTTPLKNDPEKRTIKPLYANEIYHVDDNINVKEATYDKRFHLLLIAKNDKGLENLFQITTEGGINKVKPKGSKKEFFIIKENFVKQHGEGIIACSACIGGKVGRLILDNKYEEAKAWALEMNNVFDEFYLELQPHNDTLPEQAIVNEALLKMNKETGLPLVVTSDSHYVNKEDKKYHDLLKQMDFVPPFTVDAYMRMPDELEKWCIDNNVPLEAMTNTAKIADECDVDITPKDKKGLMPSYQCPAPYNDIGYLIKLTNEGLKRRITENPNINKDIDVYIKRLQYELDVITQLGFASYFLILWDWFKWCTDNDILLGPGRGSAAGSLVAYTLNITQVDPIKNGLYFERFLNPERLDEPDGV